MHVMIVDDQASQRTLVRSIVKDISESIKVSDVADPVQALLLSQKDPPDMLILDFRMPKMDGLEFVRRFRQIGSVPDPNNTAILCGHGATLDGAIRLAWRHRGEVCVNP